MAQFPLRSEAPVTLRLILARLHIDARVNVDQQRGGYSCCSAAKGSTLKARRAGARLAHIAIAKRNRVLSRNAAGLKLS
jgi:hypothetical protein